MFTTFLIVQYGLVFMLVGIAVWQSSRYNRFLGLAATILGAYGTTVGLIWVFNGLTNTTASLGFGAVLGLLAWTITMGIVMWRQPTRTTPTNATSTTTEA